MKYLAIYKSPETTTPPSTETMADMGNLIQEMTGDEFTPELREQEERSRAKLAERAKR